MAGWWRRWLVGNREGERESCKRDLIELLIFGYDRGGVVSRVEKNGEVG